MPVVKDIYPFTVDHLPKLKEVGGKGLSLIRMTQAGLPVPPGFILAVAFFQHWMATLQAIPEWKALQTALQNGSDLTPVTSALKAFCMELIFTQEQEQQLINALQSLPKDSQFAVRSSSPEEDLVGASFAGGYETTLGVTTATMANAVRSSFASLFDERVFVYKRQHGFDLEQPRIAVIVQQQIAAESAGVGFSLNPINNDYDEAVIDANWGLGESVVSGMVSPDHFVVDKVSRSIVEKHAGSKETSIWLERDGGTSKHPSSRTEEFSLNDRQLLAIVDALVKIETLYTQPMDIEWAFAHDKLYILQARPITSYIPLPPEMLTKPGERRRLYWDKVLDSGLTLNTPISPLTLDWTSRSVKIFLGTEVQLEAEPAQSLMFSAGGRIYINLSQVFRLQSAKKMAKDLQRSDALLGELLINLDEERYRAEKKITDLRWRKLLLWIPHILWHCRHFAVNTISALWNPERFYRFYKKAIARTVGNLKENIDSNISLNAFIKNENAKLAPVMIGVVMPAVVAYVRYLSHLDTLFAGASQDLQSLVESIKLGLTNNEAVSIGIELFRMSQMLTAADFADLNQLTERLAQGDLPQDFLHAWNTFVEHYGMRGPAEMELSSPRYGDEPKLALEQMSYMIDSDFDPEKAHQKHMTERQQAYEQLLQKLNGRKCRKLRKIYKVLDLLGGTRDTPKYLLVLNNGALRQRALIEGRLLVRQGRIDAIEDIFWFTIDEIDMASADPSFDLRRVREKRLFSYQKLKQVHSFPQLIDSRGRIGQLPRLKTDPNILTGLGISRGVATGRVKVLRHPREKAVEKGDVLVAYTTDPGWTPLFVNAEAILLEIGGMLQHGGVVAREYGKPCVAGIQGVTNKLQDGQKIEVNGTTGVVRILT